MKPYYLQFFDREGGRWREDDLAIILIPPLSLQGQEGPVDHGVIFKGM